ncbi:16S rRNA (guanine(966)-N(2))-methyltransferase RsmD [Guggenheimella bovis]
MRVIAGVAKGVPLVTIKERTTRPTIDRVKESLFNIIQGYIPDATVIDCFAGSGSLCIECLSRGAELAVFVEKNPEAMECVRKNLEKTHLKEKALCMKTSFSVALQEVKGRGLTFDIIFLDPPHRSGLHREAMRLIDNLHLLKDHGIIVCEHHTEEAYEDELHGFLRVRKEKYGNTTLSFYEKE